MSGLMDIVENNVHTSCLRLQATADEINMVRNGKQYSQNTSVNVVLVGKKCHYIKAADMYTHITNTVNDTTRLGFTGDDLGNQSIRSSLAIALYLARRVVSTIILIGRWSSDAFLLYIRRQIHEFSAGISVDMVAVDIFSLYQI